jgi:hypothetical protein
MCGVGDDVRTRFELLQHDPEFIEIIDNIKKLKAMVEEAGCIWRLPFRWRFVSKNPVEV